MRLGRAIACVIGIPTVILVGMWGTIWLSSRSDSCKLPVATASAASAVKPAPAPQGPPSHVRVECEAMYGGRWAVVQPDGQPYGTGGILAWREYGKSKDPKMPPWADTESSVPVVSNKLFAAADCGKYADSVIFSFLR